MNLDQRITDCHSKVTEFLDAFNRYREIHNEVRHTANITRGAICVELADHPWMIDTYDGKYYLKWLDYLEHIANLPELKDEAKKE